MKTITLTIEAGKHTRKNAPMTVKLPDDVKAVIDSEKPLALCYAGGKCLPAQLTTDADGDCAVAFVLDELTAGEKAVLTLCNTCACAAPKMQAIQKADAGKIEFTENGAFITAYQYAIGFAKPHIGPITNKYGENITRYDFTAKEHPHHRSIWFSHGSVALNGVTEGIDTWNEFEHHGFIKTAEIEKVVSGSVFCGFTAKNVWMDENDTALCEDKTIVTFTKPEDGITVIDVDLTLTAAYGDITLGTTKEAGPIAVRMDETLRADRTGSLTNSWGADGEDEIWMKKACWNDYTGMTEGGHTAGVAIFDNPRNEGYPTYWHSRNYGLFAPNRFYLGGDEVVAKGDSKRFIYRIVIHEGAQDMAPMYVDYIAPAKAAFAVSED
ncbi:MAG: PmoA family protein [Clostridia bacterium]|nr:PmoA family protein [Clostridia bacterium]